MSPRAAILALGLALAAPWAPAAGAEAEATVWAVGNMRADGVLNVRAEPSLGAPVRLRLPAGTGGFRKMQCVVRTDADGAPRDWCALGEGEGPIGWVDARYLVPDAAALADGAAHPFPLGNGFRAFDDPCRIAGESPLTAEFLDHAAWLVACPRGETAGVEDITRRMGGVLVGVAAGYTLISVPR